MQNIKEIKIIKKLSSESLKSKWNKIVKNKIENINIVDHACSFCYWFNGRKHECIIPTLLCKECFHKYASKTLMGIILLLSWNIDEANLKLDYTDYKELEDYYKRGVYLIHKSLKQLSKKGILDKRHSLEVEFYIIVGNNFIKIYEEEFEKRKNRLY